MGFRVIVKEWVGIYERVYRRFIDKAESKLERFL